MTGSAQITDMIDDLNKIDRSTLDLSLRERVTKASRALQEEYLARMSPQGYQAWKANQRRAEKI